MLLQSKLRHPDVSENYDVVLVDTQGAVGPIQEAATFAADAIISPVVPETLSAREFLSGTQEVVGKRLSYGSMFNMAKPALFALLYSMDRTKDARLISETLKQQHFQKETGFYFMNTIVPSAKAYKEATSLRVPVHCHETIHAGKSASAYHVMHQLAYELFPSLLEHNVHATCFNNMTCVLPSLPMSDVLSFLEGENENEVTV